MSNSSDRHWKYIYILRPMRLLYRWFCRIIGVGSALDIMNLYVMMLFWIVVVLIAILPEEVDGKKHRSSHRQGHHHHRNHHHKNPKLHHHLPINGNFTIKRNSHFPPKNLNLTNIVTTKPWIFNETSTTLFVNSSFVDKEEIESLHKKINSDKINFLPNSEQISNDFKNSSSFNNYTELNNNSESSRSNSEYKNSSHPDFRNIFVASQITMRVIEESTTQFFSQSLPSSSRLEEVKEIKRDVSTDTLNNSFDITEVKKEKVAEDLQNLFGSPKDQKYSTDSFIDNNPVVELIRKRRSAVIEAEKKSVNGKIRKETLQDFSGPTILNDPEEIADLEEPNALHKRVKRDGSEIDDDDRSALSSLDSTYLRNLEDSFPLSALEVQAQRSQNSGNRKNVARSKRGIELDAEEENTKNGPFEAIKNSASLDLSQENNSNEITTTSEKTTLADSAAKSINPILPNRVNDVEHETDNISTLDLSAEQKTTYFQKESQKYPANLSPTEVNSILNRVNSDNDSTEAYISDIESSRFSAKTTFNFFYNNANSVSEKWVNVEHPAEIASNFRSVKEDVSNNDSAIMSRSSTPTEWTFKYIEPVLKNRVNDIEPQKDISIVDKNKTQSNRDDDDVNREQSSTKDAEEHPRRSRSDNSIVKEDDSISRYGLDDVYPEIIQESENPSSMVELVRTKRFGDSIVYPEAPDASYAKEIDNSRTADEPYAEDNRIIDSMLSKVEYRNVGEQDPGSDNQSPFNEDEIETDKQNYNKREDVAIREKRGKSLKRNRKKKGNNRRSYAKQKKSHKKRAKKHDSQRCKKNRSSRNLSKREFDIDNTLSDMKRVDSEDQLNDNEEDVISAHERQRRESEDEDEDNYYLDTIETAERVRRDIKLPEKNSDDNISPNALVNMENKIRDKRKSDVEKIENLKNIAVKRETNVEQNRSDEVTNSQEADMPIQDIRKLVVQLLTKVDELLGSAENGGGNGQRNAENNTNNVLQQKTNSQSAGNTAQAHVITRSEACWKHPTSWNSEFKEKKNSGPARNLRSKRCGKNSRRKRKSHHKWDRWTDWSSCSVTCGRGRQIRWRHCVRNCSNAETEMEEKACQLPACAPGKFLGIFG